MNISIILAHPHLGSFNHAIANVAAESLVAIGHDVSLHDLYQERFPSLLSAAESTCAACTTCIAALSPSSLPVHGNSELNG